MNYPFDDLDTSVRIDNFPIIGDRYRVEKAIGKGGIATVFLANDIYKNQHVALKVALPGDPQCVQAIKDEFYFGITHRHPTLANPLTLLFHNNIPIIAMPYLQNPEINTLEACLCRLREGSMENLIDKFIAQIFECAAFIHHSGYVYNDFKPANFIIQKDDDSGEHRPILLDFNLVSPIGDTQTKRGTIHYTAPEILLGRQASPRSDLYSIGVMLYELFAGRLPYVAQESSDLIKIITESGELDLSGIPDRFKKGVGSLLERNPDLRPSNARQAAELFDIENYFEALLESRCGYYLSAGAPPFAIELKRSLLEYIAEKPEKIFLIRGLSNNRTEIDFLMAEFAIQDYHIECISKSDNHAAAGRILDALINASPGNGAQKCLLLIDDLNSIDASNLVKLRALVRAPRNLPVVASQKRWQTVDLPCRVFDPLTTNSSHVAAREALKANLKLPEIESDFDNLALATGGDPELIYIRLKNAVSSRQLDIFSIEPYLNLSETNPPDLEAVGERMFSSLSEDQKAALFLLSVWGNSVPFVILSEFDEKQMTAIDSLVQSGHLRREKDGLCFPSDDARTYIYKLIPDNDRPIFHRFWAEIAEIHLEESDEFSEIIAAHWGLSDNQQKGYSENLTVARRLFSKGELPKAKAFAKTALSLSERGGGARPIVLMLYGDILKQEGDYPSARRYYIDLLRLLAKDDNPALKAETFKDLGDLSRSLKQPKRALHYTRKALRIFDKLNEKQGLASCYNNIGLIQWVDQKYDEALASFFSALELNKQLGNFRELAKAQSNIGIIKDITGKTSEVSQFFEAALANARLAEDPKLVTPFANNLGYFYIRQNELEKARKYLLEALEIAEKLGHIEVIINSLSNLGLCSLRQGRLFESLDYNQKAWQMAESLGNRHLALDAQLYLAEVSILMGNLSLADNVMSSLESDEIYSKNKPFQTQLDLLRSSWRRDIGDLTGAFDLAQKALSYALEIGDPHLAIEAELAVSLAKCTNADEAWSGLAHIREQAVESGDLANSAGLAIVRICIGKKDFNAARLLLEKLSMTKGISARNRLEAMVLTGECAMGRGRFDQSINILTETESEAANLGFIPLALEAASTLAVVFCNCGKNTRSNDILKRAESYANRISSTMPVSLIKLCKKLPIIEKFTSAREICADREYVKL